MLDDTNTLALPGVSQDATIPKAGSDAGCDREVKQ